jgi:hypothetical protein
VCFGGHSYPHVVMTHWRPSCPTGDLPKRWSHSSGRLPAETLLLRCSCATDAPDTRQHWTASRIGVDSGLTAYFGCR